MSGELLLYPPASASLCACTKTLTWPITHELLSEIAKVTRPPVFAGKIRVRLVKKIHTQDRLSGKKFKFLSISKHYSLVKLGVVWLNVKSYQTDCPVKNINFRIDCTIGRAFIFHMCIPCGKTFPWVPIF